MNDRGSETADWMVPAILVGVGVVFLAAFILMLALTGTARSEPEGLVEELDVYTQCLNDHGASVPRVEARRDGGFSVTIPGSMVEGGFDSSGLREAYDECADVAPDLFDGLSGLLVDGLLGGWSNGVSGGVLDGIIRELAESA